MSSVCPQSRIVLLHQSEESRGTIIHLFNLPCILLPFHLFTLLFYRTCLLSIYLPSFHPSVYLSFHLFIFSSLCPFRHFMPCLCLLSYDFVTAMLQLQSYTLIPSVLLTFLCNPLAVTSPLIATSLPILSYLVLSSLTLSFSLSLIHTSILTYIYTHAHIHTHTHTHTHTLTHTHIHTHYTHTHAYTHTGLYCVLYLGT